MDCIFLKERKANAIAVFWFHRDSQNSYGVREQAHNENVPVPVCQLLFILLLRGLLQREVCGLPRCLHIHVQSLAKRRGRTCSVKVD